MPPKTIMKNHPLALLTSAALGFAMQSHGATIALFNFTSGSAASSDTEILTTASDVTRGSGLSGAAFTNNRLEVQGTDTATNHALNSTLSTKRNTAINNNYYFAFTVTVNAGYELDLTQLQYDYVAAQPYEFYVGVYSDKTGFTNGDGLYERENDQNNGTTYTYNDETVSLSSISALQGLTGTTEFRFYVSDGSTSTTRIFNFDDITLSGDVSAIPEPGAALLGSLGLLALLHRRR